MGGARDMVGMVRHLQRALCRECLMGGLRQRVCVRCCVRVWACTCTGALGGILGIDFAEG
ncbi:hypothetical protein ATCC53582_02385 [Novacetimonas hansenii]|nr:hypothetical protein ATCC53582_02385 [Novacetimonas hansenii]